MRNTNSVEFDWEQFDDQYVGGSRLVENKSIKTKGREKVYCHESYAQDLYDKMDAYFNGRSISPKDQEEGVIYSIKDIKPISDHEVRLDSDNGMSSVVDLSKEKMFLDSISCKNISEFIKRLDDSEFKSAILGSNIVAKVVDNNRVSIWEGMCALIEQDMMNDLNSPDGPHYAYPAKILSVGNGGYTVDVKGLQCFMPGSLASSGPISDFESLVGKTVNVCVVNYSPLTKNFVVSYKKYLEKIMPYMVREELEVGMQVVVRVTGASKNGLFCAIRRSNGDFVYPSLMHRTTMSSFAENEFDHKRYIVGDIFPAFIHKINWIDDNNFRIVIGDKKPDPNVEEEIPENITE